VYNPSRLRHLVPDKSSLLYIIYRKLIKKHRRRHLTRVFYGDDEPKDHVVSTVASEPDLISSEQQNSSCFSAGDSIASESVHITSSSSSSNTTPVSACTAVISRSSFSIVRLLSLPEDTSTAEDVKVGPDAGNDNARKSSTSLSPVVRTSTESVTSQDQSATVGGVKDSLGCADVKPVPVHFKKRMLSSATVSSQPASLVSEPAVVGRSVTPRRSFTIHQDAATGTSTPPAKVGIVISHGRAMTLQDKMQMTTNAARRSPTSSARSLCSESASSPLRVHERHSTPVAPHYKLKRHQKPVVKRSLIPTPKVRYFHRFFEVLHFFCSHTQTFICVSLR